MSVKVHASATTSRDRRMNQRIADIIGTDSGTLLRDTATTVANAVHGRASSTDVLVRYPDGSKLLLPMTRAAQLYADEIGTEAIGREGFLLVLHRR